MPKKTYYCNPYTWNLETVLNIVTLWNYFDNTYEGRPISNLAEYEGIVVDIWNNGIPLFKDDDQRSSLGWMLQSSKIRGPQISISVIIKINVMVMVFNVCKRNCIQKPLLSMCTTKYEITPIKKHAKRF